MKNNSLLSIGLIIVFVFTLFSCEEGGSPGCLEAGPTLHRVNNVEASISEDPDTGAKIIRYAVPGTFDSVWVGIVCNEVFPDFLITKNTRVRFSGHFKDDLDQIQRPRGLLGEEFFFLHITFIEAIN